MFPLSFFTFLFLFSFSLKLFRFLVAFKEVEVTFLGEFVMKS